MRPHLCATAITLILWATLPALAQPVVGPVDGGHIVPTLQTVRPAGETVAFGGRPVDLALAPDGAAVYAKDNRGLVVIDPETWTVRQELPFDGAGGSMHGLAVSADGRRIFATTAGDRLWIAERQDDGRLVWSRFITLPGPGGEGASHACGVALSPDEKTAYVCLSRNNALGVVDLESGELVAQIPVGVAPMSVVLDASGVSAWVSNWGGRRPEPGERAAPSSGTPVLVDERGIASHGSVSLVDLAERAELAQVEVGLHPSGLALTRDGAMLYVANANSDTVSVVDTRLQEVKQTILVRPDDQLPFGSAPNALALNAEETRLYVANGGNNAVAVVSLPEREVLGFIPAGWYPGSVREKDGLVYIANVKGEGSRTRREQDEEGRWHVYGHRGSVTRVAEPDAETLARYTAQVREDGRVPQALQAQERAAAGVAPKPVPDLIGAPSVFEHVIYVVKENRTYDQVFGDLPQGKGEPSLCVFGREVTPNHHALAERYVLLDNYYCNGVNSADGHSWVTEGNVTDHLEKAFGGFTRSYTFGDDPLTYSSTGFIWDNVLLAGRSFRNYGEFDYAEPVPSDAGFMDIYTDFVSGKREITFSQKIGVENLRRYTCPTFPGWNMRIPDVLRVDAFIQELREAEERGDWYDFMIVYLPQDHGSGTSPGMPTPRAHVADNDLAVGRLVEAVSNSRFWPKTCLFILEDDPQDGFDHVDGHRSICLVASPYTKRGETVSSFYNQTSVLHTIARILGVPPLNQMDALMPVMADCFTDMPDFTPYAALENRIPLDELNPALAELEGDARRWAEISMGMNFAQVDACDEDTLNRVIWHSVKGVDAPYPVALAGAHGSGLAERGLVFDGRIREEE